MRNRRARAVRGGIAVAASWTLAACTSSATVTATVTASPSTGTASANSTARPGGASVGSPSAGASSTATATPAATTSGTGGAATRVLWTDTDLTPVSRPVGAGGFAVVYTASNGSLWLRGLTPRTGQVAWQVPATMSAATPGADFATAVAGSTVYYLRPVGPATALGAALTAIDATTGRQVWTQASRVYTGMPTVCRTSPVLLCVSAGTSRSVALRVDGRSGATTTLPAPVGRAVGVDLYDSGSRSPERIERVDTVSGTVVWSLTMQQLSPGHPVTTDHGWAWWRVGDMYVGWVGAAGSENSRELSSEWSFGVRASDGKVLWREPGMVGCFFLANVDPVAYRCTGKGRAAYAGTGAPVVVTGMDLVLQGFDMATGRTTWTLHVGDAPSAMHAGKLASSSDGVSISVPIVGGSPMSVPIPPRTPLPSEMSSATGATAGAAADVSTTVGWCPDVSTWHSTVGLLIVGGEVVYDYPTHGLAHPCTSDGSPAAPPADISRASAAVVGDVLIWSSTDGIHAVSLPASA